MLQLQLIKSGHQYSILLQLKLRMSYHKNYQPTNKTLKKGGKWDNNNNNNI